MASDMKPVWQGKIRMSRLDNHLPEAEFPCASRSGLT
jgi:hypothetical protein